MATGAALLLLLLLLLLPSLAARRTTPERRLQGVRAWQGTVVVGGGGVQHMWAAWHGIAVLLLPVMMRPTRRCLRLAAPAHWQQGLLYCTVPRRSARVPRKVQARRAVHAHPALFRRPATPLRSVGATTVVRIACAIPWIRAGAAARRPVAMVGAQYKQHHCAAQL